MNDKMKMPSAIIALILGFFLPSSIIKLMQSHDIDNPYIEFILLMIGLAAIIYGIVMLIHLRKQKKNPQVKYVASLSANAKVFHRPSCRSVKMMSRENMMTYGPEITYQQMIYAGMQPCSKCKPR